jgi:hypothetical protein
VRIEGGLKNNPRGFFKYADMKRNASGYPFFMFLGSDCARDSQRIANLFAGFFQSVYVRDDWIPDGDLPTPGDDHKMSAIEVSEDEVECAFLGLDVNKGPGPDGITPAILKRLASVVKVPLTFVLTCHCLLVFFLPFGKSLLLFLCSRAAISVMCPVIAEYRSCRTFRNYSRKWYAIG